jgi:alkanesulfonate monooxygenase SsuD/methylene tetrahydromethanopterin reductase-like flavin-dependent oxidoreductase (luciferase family)
MTDYLQDVRFGANVDPTVSDPSWPLRLTQAIERVGLGYIGIQDHPYNSHFLDTWTLMATLLQATERVHIFPNVANLPLRPPAMLAKAAATLDVLSGGRVELGLGAGAYREGIEAMGGSGRSSGEAVEALEEAVQIIRAFWSGTRALQFEGKYYSVKGAHPGPLPLHSIGLWLGSHGPRSLRVLGRFADGWIPSSSYVPPEALPEKLRLIDAVALEAGRKPEEIRRIYNVMGMITNGPMQDRFVGPVEYWVDELTRLVVEIGIDTFIYWPADDRMSQIELFAAEVVPAVKDQVAKVRNLA